MTTILSRLWCGQIAHTSPSAETAGHDDGGAARSVSRAEASVGERDLRFWPRLVERTGSTGSSGRLWPRWQRVSCCTRRRTSSRRWFALRRHRLVGACTGPQPPGPLGAAPGPPRGRRRGHGRDRLHLPVRWSSPLHRRSRQGRCCPAPAGMPDVWRDAISWAVMTRW